MIKKSFRLMLLVAFALSSVMFVSCNKYDDDIERIDNELAALNATVTSLKAAVDGGAVISSVSNTTDGVKFTLSNGQSYTVNHGTAGANGANGTDGKNGSVVTIGENGNWFIDGVDTGMASKGAAGNSPKINEAGNWEIWDVETEAWVDTNVSAVGASTYVVDNGSYYVLNVMEKVDGENTEYVTVNLPKTAAITDIKAVKVNASNAIEYNPIVTLNYGKVETAVKWKGATYAKANSYLVAAGSSLTAMINPLGADATMFNFSLVDSKGNAPYVISNIEQHMSEKAITKADPTPNKGLWTMDVAFAADTKLSKTGERKDVAYALAAETMNGTVISAYDVVVVEKRIGKTNWKSFDAVEVKINKELDLTTVLTKNTNFSIDGVMASDQNVLPYVVEYDFELSDETIAAQYGIELNGNVIKASKAIDDYKVIVNYLTIAGEVVSQPVKVSFKHVEPGATVANKVEWTVNAKNKTVYLPLGDLQASLIGNGDAVLPKFTVAVSDWSWADGTAFNKKSVIRNGVEYGKDTDATDEFATYPSGNLANIVVSNTGDNWYTLNSKGKYVKATKIQDALYIPFTFDETTAFPGDYKVVLHISKGDNNTGNVDFAVPVEVSIYAPEATIVRYDKYFSGNDAEVYGTPGKNNVGFELVSLFDVTGFRSADKFTFEETAIEIDDDVYASPFLSNENGHLVVPKYTYDDDEDNDIEMIYATREYTAVLLPYSNKYIEATRYTFNATVKSAIAEGTFTTTASKTITTSEAVKFFVTDFTGVDVYGDSFYFGNTYKYDSKGKFAGIDKKMDTRIVDVDIEAADKNAEDYLTIGAMDYYTEGNDPADHFKVSRKTNLPKLTEDAECTVKVILTDAWGVKTEATVTVVVKAF